MIVVPFELETVHNQSGQQVRIASVRDLNLSQHTCYDDFDVLVADLHALQAIDLLNFVDQVLLNSLFAANSQNIVRNKWTFDKCLTSLYGIT